MTRLVAFPATEPLDHYVVQEGDQLRDLCARFETLHLYGELDGIVFTGDRVTADTVTDLTFWWRTSHETRP